MKTVAKLPLKSAFHLPQGVIYMDGNSLGPLPRAVPARVAGAVAQEWGAQLIGGWNGAGWMDQPARVGDRVGRLIGAAPGSVVMGDTLSVKVYQALAAALALRPDRRVILSDSGNFPTDLYMAEGLIKTLGQGHELRLVAPEDVADHLAQEAATHTDTDTGPKIAAVLLTQVDYRSGRRHDMARLTAAAQAAGAVMIWDLAHSAGAMELDLAGSGAEFAVGCTYKYLNGGPGAPAFIYVRPDLAETVEPALAGWLGHAAPFAFETGYRPAPGIARMRVGTPPVLQMTALEAALDVFDRVSMADLRAASVALSERFIAEVAARCPMLRLVSPPGAEDRGSQVSFAHDQGYAAMQALIAHGVVGDFRAPDILRFGITPLTLDEADILAAAKVLERVMGQELWRDPAYQVRRAVT